MGKSAPAPMAAPPPPPPPPGPPPGTTIPPPTTTPPPPAAAVQPQDPYANEEGTLPRGEAQAARGSTVEHPSATEVFRGLLGGAKKKNGNGRGTTQYDMY